MPRGKGTPKHARVREQLRKKIQSGEWSPGTRLPPQTKLFKTLKASDSTVVHALRDLVREGLLIRRRGDGTYVADFRRPPLIPGRNLRLAILWLCSAEQRTIDKGFCAEATRGAMRQWGVKDVAPEFVASTARQTTEVTYRQPERAITVDLLGEVWGGRDRCPPLKAVADGNYDGVLTLSIIEKDYLSGLLDLGLPTVIVDYPSQTLGTRADLVYADPQIGFRSAVEHYVSMGLKRIHFIGSRVWDPNTIVRDDSDKGGGIEYGRRIDPDSFLRLSAYRQAMSEFGLEPPESWVHFVSGNAEDHQSHSTQLVTLPDDQRPQAVLCHGVEQAEWVIKAFNELGHDLHGAGACGAPHSGQATGIQLNIEEMGAVAGDLLISRVKRPNRSFLNVGIRMSLDEAGFRNAQKAASKAKAATKG